MRVAIKIRNNFTIQAACRLLLFLFLVESGQKLFAGSGSRIIVELLPFDVALGW